MTCKTKTLFAFLIISFCCVSFEAQEDHDQYGRWINGITEPWIFNVTTYTKDEAAAFKQKWTAVSSQSQGNEWAGDYVLGDLHKTYLRWSPEMGFAYVNVFTCSTEVLGLNYGSVKASSTELDLHPELTRTDSRPHGSHGGDAAYMLPKKYLLAKWGEQHYLVAEDKVANFYRYVAGLGEYQTGSGEDFFLKNDDFDKSPEGMPILPPGYERFLKRPIEAKITRVGNQHLKRVPTMGGPSYYESITPIRINVGRAHGVRNRMELYIVSSKFSERVEIVSVRKHSSKAFVRRFVDDNNRENHFNNDTRQWEQYPRISIGWELTTSWLLSKQF